MSPEPPGPCAQGTQEALGTRMICATKKLGETCTQAIHHFHRDHKAPCLPPKFCITTWYCFQCLLNITVVPRKNGSEWLYIFFGGVRGGEGNYGLHEYGELGKGDQKEVFLSLALFSLGLRVLYRIIANQCILRFHCHAINTVQKNTSETVQWKKPRK